MQSAGGPLLCYEHVLIYSGTLRLTEYLSLLAVLGAANHSDNFLFEFGRYPSRNSGKDQSFT